jgi:hypothetical protein
MTIKKKRRIVRAALVAAYVLAIAVVFVRGKEHTLLIDNMAVDEGRIAAFEEVLVSIDGGEPVEYYADDRDMTVLKGQRHRVVIEDSVSGARFEGEFRIPLAEDMVILYLPRMAAGEEPSLERFVPLAFEAPPDDDEPIVTEFLGDPEPALEP